MCGRYSFTLPPEALHALFRVITTLNLRPLYNVAPTQAVPVIGREKDGKRALKLFRWGLIPRWSKEMPKSAPLINARSEGIAEKPTFRDSFAQRRCLVPADGFYEWHKDKTSADRRPWRIFMKDRPGFAFAGVWDAWRNPDGEILRSFAIVTAAANGKIAEIHDRTPVMLRAEDEDTWLDPDAGPDTLQSLLRAYDPDKIDLYRVSTRVNSVKNDDEECLAPDPSNAKS